MEQHGSKDSLLFAALDLRFSLRSLTQSLAAHRPASGRPSTPIDAARSQRHSREGIKSESP